MSCFSIVGLPKGGIAIDDNYSFSLIVVPIPAGIWLLGSALLGLTMVVRRKTA
jgi:hypothetical protein